MGIGTEGDPWIVAESGGDYTALDSCINNASTLAGHFIEIQGSWTARDDFDNLTISKANLTITATGSAKNPGAVINTGTGAYRHYTNGGSPGHNMQISASGITFDGLIFINASSASSAEVFRINSGVTSFTLKNCNVYNDTEGVTSQKDGIYVAADSCTVNVENTYFHNWGRCGIHVQNQTSVTLNVNSCGFWKCAQHTGPAGTQNAHGAIGMDDRNVTCTVNLFNTWALDCNTATNAEDFYDGDDGSTWNISNCIDSDNSIASRLDTGGNNLASRTAVETGSGANQVVVTDITAAHYDLRLVDDITNNDAQKMHSVSSAHGLSMPTLDIAGTTRTDNYDCGPFEISAAADSTSIPLVQYISPGLSVTNP